MGISRLAWGTTPTRPQRSRRPTLPAEHGVTLRQTLALGNDVNCFTTTIEIDNNGTADISHLRFLRNFDPDQDVQAHNDYKTINDVVQRPDGAETFAIVSAVGIE